MGLVGTGVGRVRDDVAHPVAIDGAAVVSRFRQRAGVITSYSIHYTKLYD